MQHISATLYCSRAETPNYLLDVFTAMADHPTEEQFRDALHDKKFSDLTDVLKKFITFLNCSTPNGACIIRCFIRTESVLPHKKYKQIVDGKKQRPKRDVVVELDKKQFRISLKSGTGNSSHQEDWKKFEQLLGLLHAKPEEIAAFCNFIHSRDKKYFEKDGCSCEKHGFTGNDPEFDYDHAAEKKLMQRFLNKNKIPLLKHVLKSGYCSKDGWADFFFHGKTNDILSDSKFAKVDSVIGNIISGKKDFMKKKSEKQRADLYLGIFTFQRWNTCPDDKNKLDSMQVKIAGLPGFLK